jgi:predicted nucleic acid-binding protein
MGLVRSQAQSSPVLADASFLVALLNKREARHLQCRQACQRIDGPIVTCEACVAETFHLLRHAGPAVNALLANIREGAIEIPFRLYNSAAAVHKLMEKYADTPCDFADACLIAMADELNTGDILTLDSDFKHYRWRRNRSFRFLIPLAAS